MKISYCTTCHRRLWQLKKTLDFNLKFTRSNYIEICILVFNDEPTYKYLISNYSRFISDGRLKIFNKKEYKIFKDGSEWSCGYVKNLAHKLGSGDILFNLDADNFIDEELQKALLDLKSNELLITSQTAWKPDGRSGRIGVHKNLYSLVEYRDMGERDDGDFINRCMKYKIKIKQLECKYAPIEN